MTAGNRKIFIRAALAAVRDCADTMEDRAASLVQALPTMPMDERLRATTIELAAGLRDAAGRVVFELALLQPNLGEGEADAATVIQGLIGMDATMMGALAPVAEVADGLESAAERDDRYERAFVLVIEAAGVMLQGLEKARAATAALSAAGSAAARK